MRPGAIFALALAGIACQATRILIGDRDAGAADVGTVTAVEAGVHDQRAFQPAGANLSGRWAMFTFEDPVAIEVEQSGNTLSGTGCYGGLLNPDDVGFTLFCNPLRGDIEGLHAVFTLSGRQVPYAADVFVSADGQRMAGRFHATGGWYGAFAWLRIGPDDRFLTPLPAADALAQIIDQRQGAYQLTPIGTPPPDVETFGDGFRLSIFPPRFALAGTLGSFWGSELTWTEAEQTLVAGPVPVTSAAVAIKLAMHFEGVALTTIGATMPGGGVYTFSAARLP